MEPQPLTWTDWNMSLEERRWSRCYRLLASITVVLMNSCPSMLSDMSLFGKEVFDYHVFISKSHLQKLLSLEMAIKEAAKASPLDTGIAVSGFYYHRLLYRVFSDPGTPSVLRGGFGVLARTVDASEPGRSYQMHTPPFRWRFWFLGDSPRRNRR